MSRGCGKTKKQMEDAPIGSIYIWCNSNLSHPKRMVKHIDREDLKIVGKDWLCGNNWRGAILSGIVIDHATELSINELGSLIEAKNRIKEKRNEQKS